MFCHLLQLPIYLQFYKFPLLCFLTAFAFSLICIPPLIRIINKYKLHDLPNSRKEHILPVPTLGGVAIMCGMVVSLALWFPFTSNIAQVGFFFCIVILFALGIMDDLKNLSAKYKFFVQAALALIIALTGIRIQSLEGFLGIGYLPIGAQYFFTVLTIVGVTNAFNLIDGIDGLAGGLAFMSLITLGIILSQSGDMNTSLVAFALAGAVLAFLYFNFNPAKIFMGDTGSLLLGFVISVLSIRFMQINGQANYGIIPHSPVFVMGIVLIPVFDTLRVFAGRIWKGTSPFMADKTHIHHILTIRGFTHQFATKMICFIHAVVLMEIYWLRNLRQEILFTLLLVFMLLMVQLLKNMHLIVKIKAKVTQSAKST